jgi:hypothetical protein
MRELNILAADEVDEDVDDETVPAVDVTLDDGPYDT